MYRIRQIFLNSFLRVLGFFEQRLRSLTQTLTQYFQVIWRALGFSSAPTLLDSENDSSNSSSTQASVSQAFPTNTTSSRRRSSSANRDMEYFRKLARESRTSN